MTLLHKRVPVATPSFAAKAHVRASPIPLFAGVWRWMLAAVGTQPSQAMRLEVLAQHSSDVFLKRHSWLVIQQGRCELIAPMQWQAERMVQPQRVLEEGEAWQVPSSGYYQIRPVAPVGSGAADVATVVLSQRP